ncbi:G-protein coupled bile acid receptor 1-like [Brienomyrus brachyistius]|uniref:G-protein coupled bile acid receptor 1-like n=1 Tax=Brienomyrus brachyistius TaxID=42636 RepID=UPI0020B1DDB3|nr:G-protein coupled bile acid receptor 1-like [Brienomyrus brachyistius]
MGSGASVLDEGHLIYSMTVPLSTVIILANLLILLGIVCNRQLHNTPNYFFLSLLVADLCTGVALPFIPWMGLNRDLGFDACLLVHIFPNFLFLSFLSNLVMVHYERYVCIVSPLHYSHFWAHRCFLLALLVVWVPPLLYASLPAFGWNNRRNGGGGGGMGNASVAFNDTPAHWNVSVEEEAVYSAEESCSYRVIFPTDFIYLEVYGLLVPAIISVAAMTARVLIIARRQLRSICKLHRAAGQAAASEAQQRLNLRYARCVTAVSLTFLVCWVPYIVYLHVSVALLRRDGGPPVGPTIHTVLSCTGIGSMAIIPVVLGLGNRQYTDPARELIRRMRERWVGGCCSGGERTGRG